MTWGNSVRVLSLAVVLCACDSATATNGGTATPSPNTGGATSTASGGIAGHSSVSSAGSGGAAGHASGTTGGGAGGTTGGTDAGGPIGGSEGGGAPGATGGFGGGSPSMGCGTPVGQNLAEYATYTVHTTGITLDDTYTAAPADRDYAVWLPPTYDPTISYRTVFVASACGSSPTAETRYMDPDHGDRSVIYVGLAPYTHDDPSACFDNSGLKSSEWEYFAQVATAVEARFCVNRDDELIAGIRTGGTVANMMGCYFSNRDPNRTLGPDLKLRAQFSVASGLPADLPLCGGPIAGFWMHDTNEINPPTDSAASRDRVLQINGCTGSATEDWGADSLAGIGCKKYTSCPPEYPVVYCETTGRGRQSNYYSITAPALVQFTAELGDSQ